MPDKERFQANLALLYLKDPDLKPLVENTDPGSITFCKTEKKEQNLKDQAQTPPSYLYDQRGAWQETKLLWDKINKNTDVLYMYGIGLGYMYVLAHQWLLQKKDRYLVFIEDDPRVLYRFLETERATDILLNPQVKILFFSSDPEGLQSFNKKLQSLAWHFVFLNFDVAALSSYLQARKNQLFILTQHLGLITNNINTYAGEYTDLCRRVFRNVYPNSLHLDSAYLANHLYGKFKNIPAIICGAGASLNKNIQALKAHHSKALLFAGGAAISFLNNHDLHPHFGSLIDPEPPYQRYFVLTDFETPFFYQTRASHEVLSLIHGQKILVEDYSAMLLEGWLKEKLHIPTGHFSSSYTVGDFSLILACMLGCNPIFLIGMDLAYTEEKYYALGVAHTAPTSFDPAELIQTKDIFGNTTFTKSDWMLSAKKIALIAKENPQCTIINTTEGGIGFEGIPNLPFTEAAEKYLSDGLDLSGQIHTIFSEAPPLRVPLAEAEKLLQESKASLEHCLRLAKDMLKTLNEIHQDWQGKTEEELDLSKTDFILLQERMQLEIAYQKMLSPLWDVVSKITMRRTEEMEKGKDKKVYPLRLMFHEVEFYRYAAEVHLNIIFEAIRRANL